MLRTAVSTVQSALWGEHPPTIFGNRQAQLDIAIDLAYKLTEDDSRYAKSSATVHHAKDGCFHMHYSTKAFLWADHLSDCPVKGN